MSVFSKRSLDVVRVLLAATLVGAVGCGGSKPAPTSPTSATLNAPTAKTPIGGAQLDTVRPTVEVTNAVGSGNLGTVTYRFEISKTSDFAAGPNTITQSNIPQGSGTTTWTPSADLDPNTLYYWHALATNGSISTAYSSTETFKSAIRGFISGSTVVDPLTNGQTVGVQRGGTFVPAGWQAITRTDGIDYQINTCAACTVDFDATNFGVGVFSDGGDLKWFSMSEGAAFAGFYQFRDSPWKMQLERRSDGDGTGLKVVWRNGGGEVALRIPSGLGWTPSQTFHFTIEWTPAGFTISVNGKVQFQSGFDGGPYVPSNQTLTLGCWPRTETIPGIIYSNVKVTPK